MSKRSEKRIEAAEEVCRALRKSIFDHGGLTQSVLPYLDRWMRLSHHRRGKTCYSEPKPIRKKPSTPTHEPLYKVGDLVTAMNGEPRIVDSVEWKQSHGNKDIWGWVLRTRHPDDPTITGTGFEAYYKPRKLDKLLEEDQNARN